MAINGIDNTVSARIEGSDIGSSGAKVGSVLVEAKSMGSIDTLAFVGSVAVSASQGLGLAATLAGSVTMNQITNTVQASIQGGSHVFATGNVWVKASDTSSIDADAASGAATVSASSASSFAASLAGAIALNTIGNTVTAAIDGSTVEAGGQVLVEAKNTSTIDTRSLSLNGAVAGGSGLGISLGGAVSYSKNQVANTTRARIGSSTIADASQVDVTATDGTWITATAGAVSIGVGGSSGAGAGIAIGVSVAENSIADLTIDGVPHSAITEALINPSVVGTVALPVGPVSVTATANGKIQAFTLAGAVGAGVGSGVGLAASGAGSGSRNIVVAGVKARILNSTLRSGAVSVSASASTFIDAEAGAGAAALGVGSGSGISFAGAGAASVNEIALTVLATIDGSTVNAGSAAVSVSATTTAQILVTSVGVSGAFGAGSGLGAALGAAGSGSRNSVGNTIEASIKNSTINTTGPVQVTATNSAKIEAYAGALAAAFGVGSGAGLGLAVGVSYAVNQIGAVTINGVMRDHRTSALIVNTDVGVGGPDAAAVTVSATTNGWIKSYSFAGTGTAGGGAGAGVAASGAGAGSSNTIVSTTEAKIAGGSDIESGSTVTVSASDIAAIHAEAGSAALAAGAGGGFGVAITVGAAFAENQIALTVTAAIDDSDVRSSGALAVTATSNATMDVVAIGMAGGLSAGGGAGIALSGAGSGAINTIANTVEARIRNSEVFTGGSDVTVWAKDSSTIVATAGAAAASIGAGTGAGLGVAVGASVSANKIGDPSGFVTIAGAPRAHQIRALIDTGSVVGNALDPVGKVTVKAESAGQIDALTYAGVAAVAVAGGGAAAGAGAGAVSQNFINGLTEAKIQGSSVRTKNGSSVEVLATNSSAILAQSGAAAVALGVAFGGGSITLGAGVADNEIGNTIRAQIHSSTVTAGGQVKVEAKSTSSIDAVAIGVAEGVSGGVFVGISLSGAGSATTSIITNTVTASIVGSVVSSGAGQPVIVDADDASDIGSFSGVLAVGIGVAIFSAGAAVGVSVATADIGNTVRAHVDDSKVTSGAAVTVDASASGAIQSRAPAGAVAGGSLFGGAAGAAISVNSIHNTVEARILDADAASSQSVSGTAVSVSATDDADILAEAIGAAESVGALSASIGFVRAENTITSGTTARIANSSVSATAGAVEVLASSTGSITARPMAAALAGGGLSVAGAGVLAKNTVTPNTTAKIEANSAVNAATSIKVEAKDVSSVDASIAAVSASAGLGAIAAGLASAENTINGAVTATSAGSNLTASGPPGPTGNIDILASANESVVTFSVVLAAAYGDIAASGVAGKTDEKIQTNVTASLTGGTLTAVGNDVNVHASFTGNSDPTTTASAVSIGFGGSFSGVESYATIGGTTTASAAGGTITANKLDVDATDHSTATSFALTDSLSFGELAVAFVKATSTVDRTTQAYVGAGALNIGSGPVNVHATSTSDSTLNGGSIAGGLAAVSGVLLDSKVATTTQAYIGNGAKVTAGAIDVDAHATNTVLATTLNLSLSLAGGTVTDILATDDSNVNAFIGPVEGSGSGGATVNATGNVTVEATLDSTASAHALTASLSFLGSIGDLTGDAENTANVRSYLGYNADITATGQTVSFKATSHSRVDTDAVGLSGSGGFAGAGVFSHADLRHSVAAFTEGGGGSISAGTISFTSNANEHLTAGDACANFGACADTTAGAAAVLGSGALTNPRATDSPDVDTYVASGTTLSASGAISVVSNVKQKAKADGLSVAIGGGFAGTIVQAETIAAGSVDTYVNGVITQASSVTVRSNVDYTVTSYAENVAASLLVAGSFASVARARIGDDPMSGTPNVATHIGGAVTASGDVNVISAVTTSATSRLQGISASFVSGRSGDSNATVQPLIRTYAGNGAVVTSTSGDVSFLTAQNYDPGTLTPITGNTARASAGSYGGGAVNVSVNWTIVSTVNTDVATTIDGGATLRAGDAVSVRAFSSNVAEAKFESFGGGIVSVDAASDPTATASGKTVADLAGDVEGTTPDTLGAQSVTVQSTARDFASAKMETATGAAIDVKDSHSTATGDPYVEVLVGRSGGKIIAAGNVTVKSLGLYDADAATSSAGGGAIHVNLFYAKADLDPTVKATVANGSLIKSVNGTVTIDATASKPPDPSSDGTFTAGDTCPIDGSNPGCVDPTTNTITFSLIHNAVTGDIVVYDRMGGGDIFVTAGDQNGRSFSLIAVSPTAIQLGLLFDGGAIDPVKDVIDFGSRAHNLETGDVVIYAGNAGGLPSGTYVVYKVDEFKLKLQNSSVSFAEVLVDGAAGVDDGADRVVAPNTFFNGDYVTYHAPPPVGTFSSRLVDVTTTGGACDQRKSGDDSNADNIFLGRDADGNDCLDAMGLNTGDAITYTASDPSKAIGGLTSGNTYYVIKTSDHTIQLAQPFPIAGMEHCYATGTSGHPECFAPDDFFGPDPGSAPDPIPQTHIVLTPDKTTPAFVAVVHTITRASDFAIGGLTDGRGYYVVGCGPNPGDPCSDDGFFQLSATPGGAAIPISDGGGFPHVFRREGVDITAGGTGQQSIVVDLQTGSGTQRMVGIGGAGFAANDGDGVVSASATGGGGGAINVADAQSEAKLDLVISNTVGANATIRAGGEIFVTTNAFGSIKAVASNGGGGLISVGLASADTELAVDNTINVQAGANLIASGNVTVKSRSELRPTVIASSAQGGLGAGALSSQDVNADYRTETIIAGNIHSSSTASVDARTWVDSYGKLTADVGGLGADAETDAKNLIGFGTSLMSASAFTHVQLSSGANVTGRNVHLNAIVEQMKAVVDTRTRATALGANSNADGTVKVKGSNEITLQQGSTIIGNVATNLLSEYQNVILISNVSATCRCLGGDTDADATTDAAIDARVVAYGPSSPAALIKTSDLTVAANQQVVAYQRNPDRSGGFLDFGGEHENGDANFWRRIFWEAHVIMLGEPNPWMEVDAAGNITKLVNVCGQDSDGHAFCDDPFNNVHTTPQLTGHTIYVDDVIYDHGANARLLANGLPSLDGESTPDGEIWGELGVFEFQQTWDYVKLFNSSSLNLVVNSIDVVNTLNNPKIDIRVDEIWDDGGSGPYTPPGLDPASPGPTFDFDIKYTFPPTDVLIKNLCPSVCPVRQPYIQLGSDFPDAGGYGSAPADYIENPIGLTRVENLSGDILSGPNMEIIRTNILELYATHGDIGHQSPTHANPDPERNPIAVELVRWQDQAGAYHAIQVRVDAGKDAVLDLAANRRTDEALGSAFSIAIERINAGDDVDLVLNDSKNGNDVIDIGLVRIDLYNPGTTLYHFVFPGPYSPAPADSGPLNPCPGDACGSGSGLYETHFRPDGTLAGLERVLRAFGTATSELDSTYVFTAVRAGDDIDICHVTTGGEEPKTCPTTSVDDATWTVSADSTPDTTVHVTANTDVDWSGGAGHAGPLDDGLAINFEQIFIRTNGDIVDTELVGDLLAGHIHSTQGDVTLHSPMRILDANRQPTIDVTGENITLFSGEDGGVGGIGVPAQPDPDQPASALVNLNGLGGYLEINGDVNNNGGHVDADDTASADALTLGIYLDELTGDLRIGLIITAGDASLATGNVALRTVNGSIVDALNDAAADVVGQSIDIDANGGSIGSSGNDLDIDSLVGSPWACTVTNCADVDPDGAGPALPTTDPALAQNADDVSLEATQNIYVTETDSWLRLLLAHAVNGDIRITVRESADHDEDLYLVEDGSARFAESNLRAPSGDDLDAERIVPKGQVFAETGNVTLRVGDDVATHQNSEILANGDIDLFGDFGDLDTGWGTNMILRGRIIADCVVSGHAPASGHPVGTCAPETAATPAHTTEIWGGDDVDTFQLGDPSGANTCASTAAGQLAGCSDESSDGWVFLGAKTFIRGSDDTNPAGDAGHDPSLADGEDRFVVYYLQSMDVTGYGAVQTAAAGAGHDLTLDGQADTDWYNIYTTGSRGQPRHYVINILDTGAPDDGSDQAFIYGLDNMADEFNGYQEGSLTEKNPNDDVFLLRRVLCIDTQAPYSVNAAGVCGSPTSLADDPAFVAILHGDLDAYRDLIAGNESSTLVQRINYDAALNGRLSVYGRGGNDYFFSDDNSATTTLDGGFGFDTFQIGQIFGLKRDCFVPDGPDGDSLVDNPGGCGFDVEHPGIKGTAGGGLKPPDVFPDLIATTRGWLSPGTHAPLVATGGTGNDEFIVYSNQAELRLEGDDDNDLFIIRAFALAVVCDTDANGDGECDNSDIDDPYGHDQGIDPDGGGPLQSETAPNAPGDHVCGEPIDPDRPLTGTRLDNPILGVYDGVCNAADAHTTPPWWDDEIIFDCKDALPTDPGDCSTGRIVARPIIGGGFSTGEPLDVRTGGGDDEVQYNINAPVSVDGGTGFDKMIVLGTEFADDFVITAKGIFGAGLNVRYANLEVVEIDGLEGDDEFFVQSTAFGVAYRVIGGLGSDTINVTGDVTEDIIVRDLEGISGTLDHLVTSDDPLYDGLAIDGVGLHVASDQLGLVVIEETGGFTSVRENGLPGPMSVDSYKIYLSAAPSANVYITVSAARSPQEEAEDTFDNPPPLPDGNGDTVWLCVGTGAAGECDSIDEFRRMVTVNGQLTTPENRAFVLTFSPNELDPNAWNIPQWVYLWAVDETDNVPTDGTPDGEVDPRSEGDRVHVIQHSVISADARFDGVAVRNVEATIRDNDTPGIYVTQVEILGNEGAHTAGAEDRRTIVIEGTCINQNLIPGSESFCAAGQDYTGLLDIVLVELAKELDPGQQVVVDLVLDFESARAVTLVNLSGDPRFVPPAVPVQVDPVKDLWRLGSVTFDDTNWNVPVQVGVRAYNDITREDPAIAVVAFRCSPLSFTVCGPHDPLTNPSPYPFPNLRSGPGLLDIEVIDDETAGGVAIESEGNTLVVRCSPAPCVPLVPDPNDEYTLRITRKPTGDVEVAILTDGLTDVVSVDGAPATLEEVGGYLPAQAFSGSIVFDQDGGGFRTLTRGTGADLGSFLDEGFEEGMFIQIANAGANNGNFYLKAVTEDMLTLLDATPWATSGELGDVVINRLTRRWLFEGTIEAISQYQIERFNPDGSEILDDDPGWLTDGFLEGQRVKICVTAGPHAGECADNVKIALIRGGNDSFDSKLDFTLESGVPLAWVGAGQLEVEVVRIATVVTFTSTDWYVPQVIELAADPFYDVPVTRAGSKFFPVSTHLLSKLRGPLAVEGGVTGADRSLKTGVKLPGELDAGPFEISAPAPESQQIDVLNIFNDDSQQDRSGVMTSTTLTGFGMAKDLEFGGTAFFGEPATFPGGISFGTIAFVDGQFVTDGAKSTIEVLNLLLGKGNDHLDIQGTLDPAPPVSATGRVDVASAADGGSLTRLGVATWEEFGFFLGQPVTIEGVTGAWVIGGFSGDGMVMTLTGGPALPAGTNVLHTVVGEDRPVDETQTVTVTPVDGVLTDVNEIALPGFDWKAAGFMVGHLVMISGLEPEVWRVVDMTDSGDADSLFDVLTLRGDLLPAGQQTLRLYVPGPHGGLTVVHGGGNLPLESDGSMVVSNVSGQIEVRRTDGFSWTDDGYAAGQWIQIGNEANSHKIVSFADFICAPPPPGETQIPNCGVGSVMVLAGAAGAPGAFPEGHVHVSEPLKIVSSDPTLAISTNAITRDAGSWIADGFFVGQQVWISGLAGAWTVTGLTPTVMTLSGAALQPTYHLNGAGVFVMDFAPLQVVGYDVTRDGGVRIGGDTLVVCNPSAEPVCTPDTVVGGPNSPLVLYGDTSQDGVWYSGHSYDIYGYEFGEKPFDPFVNLPDGDNEDDEWVFPLANPFAYHGNDIVDASALFSWIACSAACTLPTVGITAYGGRGDDLIIGSQTGDHLAGGSGDDEIVGNRGADLIYGDSGFNVNVLTRALFVTHVDASPLPTIDAAVIRFTMEGETIAPYASPVRDLLEGGDDIICGDANTECRSGLVAMNPAGPETLFDDIIFGDKGEVFQHVIDPNTPNTLLQKIQTTLLQSVLSIDSRDYQRGGDDVIFGNLGRDVLVGGTGHDMADGDEADDLLFGDNVFLLRRIGPDRLAVDETDKPLPSEPNFDGDITSGRFQTLCGTLLYSRTDRPNACGGDPLTQDNSGLLLVDGVWRDYRDPDGVPWWAEYLVAFDDDFSDGDPFHTFEVQNGDKAVGSFGNDYLAGGPAHDMLFGQMGNDILQGDGEIERAFARRVEDSEPTTHAGASRTPAGCVGTPGVDLVCDYVGPLTTVPAVENMATDGQDYIEGNAGDDIAFGGLGQDDIVGGSSDFFSLNAANDLLALPGDHANYPGAELRPDGHDLLFGGAGNRSGRNDNSCLGQTTQTAAVPCAGGLDVTYNADADTIIGDNGRIIRIVGLNHMDGAGVTAPNKYVTFDYDNYGAVRLVVRGVHLLDYTPGGPDFDPEKFGLTQGDGPCSASPYTGVCSTPISTCAGSASPYADVGGRDEVHGEAGSDTAYGGCGNDVLYGDAQDDDLIGGWGNDWISGGTGQDGVIGDDGRIFTSKNRACPGPGSSVPCTVETEPLYGIVGFRTVDPDTRTSQGDVLNEFIYTPGQVQTATINVAGALKKEVDISPYNLGPNFVAGHFQIDTPLFDANNSDDVIFGGWDDDFLHGASGDDAISGAEAMEASFVQHFSGSAGGQDAQQSGGVPDGVIHVDWNRPYNPGNLLLFGADIDPWNFPKPIVRRLGEFYLYDEYDARRAILFNGAGGTWGCASFSPSGHVCTGSPPVSSFPYPFFLNLTETSKTDGSYTVPMTEGRQTPAGCIDVAPNGTCLKSTTVQSDGNDKLFGDLGNDWVIGGSGNDNLYGGWGNDLLNGDDILQTNGWLNDTRDTHPTYEDRIFGGAGLDILIINTGGDRAIDWVGEFNSYIAPFAPFGIRAVSRQVEPQLPEFLYALSQSDGADPTRDTDTGRHMTNPGRNGEYEGELGLIVQRDHGYWQEQTGGPTDPQAGNIPGGRRDVLGSADFNSGALSGFAVDSGVFEILQGALAVSAASLGQDAAAVFYGDAYLPIYYEIRADVMVQKPTAGWKANAFVIFDYFSANDFKFTGMDVSTNKMVIGHRGPEGWVVDAQAPFTGSLKSDKLYRLLIAVNGTAVTVSVDGVQALTYTFGARILNGQPVGLNKGLIGVGSDNSRGVYDNVVVQALPPELTLDSTEYFEDGAADQFAGFRTGSWSVVGGRYVGAPAGSAYALDALDPGALLRSTSYVGVDAVVAVSGVGGVAFDIYGTNDFKFVALDSGTQSVLIGHVDPRRGWVVDASFAATLSAGTDYSLGLELRGTVATVTVNGFVVGSYAYNAAVADGRVGTLSRTGTASFEQFRLRTDDPAFIGVVLPPEIQVMDAAVGEGASGTTTIVAVTLQLSKASSAATTVSWTTEPGSALPGVDYIAASGTATFAAGSTTAVIQVAVLGDGAGEANETFRVVLTSWANFNLADGTGFVTITNDDPLPVIAVSVADGTGAEEGSDSIRFTVSRTNNFEGPVSVGLSWTGAATLGADYTLSATGGALSSDGRVLTLPSGATSVTIIVTPVDDAASEPVESVTLTLLPGAGYSLGAPTSGSGAIADNDGNAVGISIGNASVSEGSKGTSKVSLTVTLSAPSASTVTVNYATVAGSATPGVDYQSVSGSLSFSPGVTSMTVSVVIFGDKAVEADETFMVVLSNAVNAAISAGIGTVTIRNDDRALLADGPSPASAATPGTVSRTELETVVARAAAFWLASVPGADFSGLSVAIEDLDGLMLGHASGSEITIDLTAAGWGWSTGARGHGVDLFTVVLHELGHVLGLDHADSAVWGVMAGTYSTRTARWAVALGAPLFGPRQAALSPLAGESVATLTPAPLMYERPEVRPGQRWVAPWWLVSPQSPVLALDRWSPTALEETPSSVRMGDVPSAVWKVLRVWFTYQRWLRSLREVASAPVMRGVWPEPAPDARAVYSRSPRMP